MGKLHGAAKRIYGTLHFILSDMARFGESRHVAKAEYREEYLKTHGNLKGYNPAKALGIFSIKTMKAYRRTMVIFAIYLAEHGIKNASQITRELAAAFLQERDASGLSAWSVSREMSAINKVFNYEFTKRELGLKPRRKKDIKNNRNGPKPKNPQKSKYRDQIWIVRASGMRFSSITQIMANHCIRNEKGQVIGIWVKEKGGKERITVVLTAYIDIVTEIVDRRGANNNGPLFEKAGVHISWQYFRAEYCKLLRAQLVQEYTEGKPFFGGELPSTNYIHLRGKDRTRGEFTHGYPTQAIAAASGAMGHNRLEIMFNNYDYAVLPVFDEKDGLILQTTKPNTP